VEAAAEWPKSRSGIYFLIKRGRVIYLGKACDVARRVAEHSKTLDFDRWHWEPCQPEFLSTRERQYLVTLTPPLNRDTVTNRARAARLVAYPTVVQQSN